MHEVVTPMTINEEILVAARERLLSSVFSHFKTDGGVVGLFLGDHCRPELQTPILISICVL